MRKEKFAGPTLTERLCARDPAVVRAAIFELGRTGDETAIPLLEPFLRNDEGSMAFFASRAIARIRERANFEKVIIAAALAGCSCEENSRNNYRTVSGRRAASFVKKIYDCHTGSRRYRPELHGEDGIEEEMINNDDMAGEKVRRPEWNPVSKRFLSGGGMECKNKQEEYRRVDRLRGLVAGAGDRIALIVFSIIVMGQMILWGPSLVVTNSFFIIGMALFMGVSYGMAMLDGH